MTSIMQQTKLNARASLKMDTHLRSKVGGRKGKVGGRILKMKNLENITEYEGLDWTKVRESRVKCEHFEGKGGQKTET